MTATEQIMALLERWDRQQEGYIRQREERYEAMFQLLEDLFGRDGRFTAIDAACGPGSLGRRLLERFPAARVVALDADVMLLEIARTALAGFAERVRVVECDLTDPAGPNGSPKRASPSPANGPRRCSLPPRCTGCRPPNSPGSTPRPANCSPPAACC